MIKKPFKFFTLAISLSLIQSCAVHEKKLYFTDFKDLNGVQVNKNNKDWKRHEVAFISCHQRAQSVIMPKYFGSLINPNTFNKEYNEIVIKCMGSNYKVIKRN